MKREWLSAALAVTALAVVAFLNGLGGEFVLDDRPFLLNNPQLGATHSLAYFFTENLWSYSNVPDAYSASYRPMFFISLWLSEQLSISGPLALHLFNLLLHVLATLLVLLTIRRMIPGISVMAAGIAVGLFAVHPVHVEAVAWVSAFIHPLTTIFLLAAYLAHDRSRRVGGIMSIVGALVFFTLALLSNEMAVAFPFFILLNDRIRYGQLNFVKNLPYLILLAVYMLVRNRVLGEPIPLSFTDPEMWMRLPAFLLEYLHHLLLPWPQPLYLQMPDNWGVSVGAMITGALYIAASVWLIRIPAEKRPAPLIAAIWIAVFLLPPMAAAFSPDARFALRSLYLPSVGFAIFLAWAIHVLPILRRPTGIVLLSSVLLLALAGTAVANRYWKSDKEVYGQVVRWNPGHFAGYLGLGQFHESRGEVKQALDQYEQSVAHASTDQKADPLGHMARLLGETGNTQRSLEIFRQLTSINPDSAAAWTGVGNNLWAMGQLEAAADAYMQALTAEPDNWTACYNLVLVLKQLGRTAEATHYIECARQPN